MSFVNCYYEVRRSTMHLWEEHGGQRMYNQIQWVPYCFFRSPDETEIKTIYGESVTQKQFRTYQDYWENTKDNPNAFENRVKPEIQFLAEQYSGIPDDELVVPKLKIYSLDIEVVNSQGFPDIWKAQDPIPIISIRDSQTKEVISFGCKPYTAAPEGENITYQFYETEEELLLRFFNFMYKNPPDIITGWNVYQFDLSYIINRCKTLFGNDTQHYLKLSPIRIVRTWKSERFNELNIDIAGVHIIDYLDLYKWYSPDKLERYKLDFVANHELGVGKLDYSDYKDLRELYEKDWNKYVEYNVTDCKRVDELEEKLGYIRLVQALSLLTKCPMKFYQKMTSLIEGALLTHFRRNNLCAPNLAGGHKKSYKAAIVKEPMNCFIIMVILL